MAQLAIKGHETRGKEVIEILEMLGGNNLHEYVADSDCFGFYIGEGTKNIYYDWVGNCYDDEGVIVFTLEEFLELYPFKVGDKVLINKKVNDVYTVKSMEWQKFFDRVIYKIEALDGREHHIDNWFAHEMVLFNRKKEETMEEKIESFEILESHCANEVKIEFDPSKFEIVKRDDGYYVVNKKTLYPKTYTECCEVLGADPNRIIVFSNRQYITHEENKHCYEMYNLYQLLICRDAYWKIAGEQMGLGKPWKPSANDEGDTYLLCYNRDSDCFDKISGLYESNAILDFPAIEMRDAFYEYFKDLIESCKELL